MHKGRLRKKKEKVRLPFIINMPTNTSAIFFRNVDDLNVITGLYRDVVHYFYYGKLPRDVNNEDKLQRKMIE